MSIPWSDPGVPIPGALCIPQEMYDEIMALPDGADLSEYFEVQDPAWVIESARLSKGQGGTPIITYRTEARLLPAPPAGAVPGAEDESEGDGIG